MVLVTTTKGEMDESHLEKRTGEIDNENENTKWVEYWLGGELVHRSVDMVLKRATVAGFPVAATF
jgi:hypothetical protein